MVQRLRIRYAKRGPMRFTSHRTSRAFERAIERANVPIAYSQGFTPTPRSRTPARRPRARPARRSTWRSACAPRSTRTS
ncbi:DUF2344 domain-containing protein [Luedemannella flava]